MDKESVRYRDASRPGFCGPVPSDELNSALLQILGAAVFICEPAVRGFPILQISPAFTAITGFTAENALGQKLDILFGSETNAVAVKCIHRALRRAEPFRGELLCYHSNGSPFWAEWIIAPQPAANGRQAHALCGMIDISERKKREVELCDQEAGCRSIFENAVEGIYQSTPEGRYLRVNLALARMYGYASPAALIEQVSDIGSQIYVDPGMRSQFMALIQEADQVRGLEYQVRRRDGRVIWISEHARAVRDGNGRVRYYEGFIEEITLRKEVEVALQQSKQRLIETSRQIALTEMADGILHNVANTLTSVNVSASIAADRVKNSKVGSLAKAVSLMRSREADLGDYISNDPKGRQLIGYLDDLAQHLTREKSELQEELVALKKCVEHAGRIIAFQQDYTRNSSQFETVNAPDMVEDALRMNATLLERSRITLSRDYASDLPQVTVQKHQVLQILVNLIRNAQKACDASTESEKRILLVVDYIAEKDFIQIEVRDNGVGIAPETLPQLFAYGFTTRKDGHGFGLHSAARIAREMGGMLAASSEGPGKGASFILEFPCQPPKT